MAITAMATIMIGINKPLPLDSSSAIVSKTKCKFKHTQNQKLLTKCYEIMILLKSFYGSIMIYPVIKEGDIATRSTYKYKGIHDYETTTFGKGKV